MADHKHPSPESLEELVETLNIIGPESARASVQGQCRKIYYWDDVRKQIANGEDREKIMEYMDKKRIRIEADILTSAEWAERVFSLLKAVFPKLKPANIKKMLKAMMILYGSKGVK